jgi:hypothetical protein
LLVYEVDLEGTDLFGAELLGRATEALRKPSDDLNVASDPKKQLKPNEKRLPLSGNAPGQNVYLQVQGTEVEDVVAWHAQ